VPGAQLVPHVQLPAASSTQTSSFGEPVCPSPSVTTAQSRSTYVPAEPASFVSLTVCVPAARPERPKRLVLKTSPLPPPLPVKECPPSTVTVYWPCTPTVRQRGRRGGDGRARTWFAR
jgi:hypothetical protein